MQFPRSPFGLCFTSTLVGLAFAVSSSWAEPARQITRKEKKVIGPTAVVKETETDFTFSARVDTGATTTSLHVEDCKVENGSGEMVDNVGKTIRFRIKNQQGQTEWLQRKIAEISVIKTSEREERRYKVPITLDCLDVKKKVLVSLNDRSHMAYPLLLGRNFLQDHFLVDVALDKGLAKESIVTAKQQKPRQGKRK